MGLPLVPCVVGASCCTSQVSANAPGRPPAVVMRPMCAARKVAADYPGVQMDEANVDAICMWLLKDPDKYGVLVATNMFGDIVTDLGAMIQGGMGVAAGGNINPEGVSMFEPIGGSAPKYTGKNAINPLAAICAGAMLLNHLGKKRAAENIEAAVKSVTATKLKSLAAGRMGYGTREVGDLVVAALT